MGSLQKRQRSPHQLLPWLALWNNLFKSLLSVPTIWWVLRGHPFEVQMLKLLRFKPYLQTYFYFADQQRKCDNLQEQSGPILYLQRNSYSVPISWWALNPLKWSLAATFQSWVTVVVGRQRSRPMRNSFALELISGLISAVVAVAPGQCYCSGRWLGKGMLCFLVS